MKNFFVIFLLFSFSSLSFQVSYTWPGICSTGIEQSPVDLSIQQGTCHQEMVLDLTFNSADLTSQLVKGEYTISANGLWSTVFATTVDGNLYGYDAESITFKAPSEHTIDGNHFDLEVQIVHKIKKDFVNYTRDKAVVSIMFNVDENTNVNFFNSVDPINSNSQFTVNPEKTLGAFVDASPVYYTYKGSLTLPDCSQSVNWYILQKPLGITSLNLKKFKSFWSDNINFNAGNGNNRPIQSLNGRAVLQGGIKCEEQFVYFFSFFILYIFINYFIFKLL